MRDLNKLNKYRDTSEQTMKNYGSVGDGTCGVFFIPTCRSCPHKLKIIASSSDGWDHVSVSYPNRVPLWAEMEQIKRLFFRPDETAMQLHVPIKDHIDYHPYVLHLWRPHHQKIPLPPRSMV